MKEMHEVKQAKKLRKSEKVKHINENLKIIVCKLRRERTEKRKTYEVDQKKSS